MDVKRTCPVCKDPLLGDEAVVAAPPASFVGNVHGTLVRTARLVVVVGDGVVLGLPVEEGGEAGGGRGRRGALVTVDI